MELTAQRESIERDHAEIASIVAQIRRANGALEKPSLERTGPSCWHGTRS